MLVYDSLYSATIIKKKKEIDKNRKHLIPEYMLMDLPLIVLIIESSFLHLNIVYTKTNIDGSALQIKYIPRYT